jgi:hypothetical protein
MATTINAANISASFDITKLKEGMNATRAEISKLGSILRTAEPATNKLSRDLDLLKRAFGSGAIDAGQFANAINNVVQQANLPPRMQSQVDKLSRSFMEGRIDIEQYRASLDKLQTRMNTLDATKAQKQVGKGGLGAGALAMGRGALGNMAGGLVAAVGVQQLTSYAAESTAKLDEIGDAAAKAGVSFSEMITLERTLSEVGGVGVDQVRSAIGKMKVNILEARDSLNSGKPNDLANSLKKIGVDINALSRMDAVTQFQTLAAATRQIRDHGEQMQVSMQMFGKAGIELVPALQVSNDQFAEMEEHLRQSNLLLSQEQAAAIGKNADEMERMRDAMVASGAQLQTVLLPAQKGFMDFVSESLKGWQNIYNVLRDIIMQQNQVPKPGEIMENADKVAEENFARITAERRKIMQEELAKIREVQQQLGGEAATELEEKLKGMFADRNTGDRTTFETLVTDFTWQNMGTTTKAMQELARQAQAMRDQADQKMGAFFADELEREIGKFKQFGEDLRNDRMEMQQADREITQERDQRERAMEQMRSKKIGEADTNIAPAIRAGTVEAYKMMNKQNEDARHRREHLAKLSSMETEMKKFNEKNFAVLSKRR